MWDVIARRVQSLWPDRPTRFEEPTNNEPIAIDVTEALRSPRTLWNFKKTEGMPRPLARGRQRLKAIALGHSPKLFHSKGFFDSLWHCSDGAVPEGTTSMIGCWLSVARRHTLQRCTIGQMNESLRMLWQRAIHSVVKSKSTPTNQT